LKLLPLTRAGYLRLAILILILLGLCGRFFLLPVWRYHAYRPQEGDIVFQSLPRASKLVRLIEGVTESPLSHCGVVVNRDGKWFVNEAIWDVHDTALLDWVRRGRGARFCVFRVKPDHRRHLPQFIAALQKYQGLRYDYDFELDDGKLYCSELVYKAFRDASGIELGRLMKLGELNWKPHADGLREYHGRDVPLDRVMITPRHLSEAEQLEKVYSAGL